MVLPKEDEDITHYYEGVKFLKVMPAASLKEIKTFEVRPDDIYLVSYPKAGILTYYSICHLKFNYLKLL